jgi:hypothetical protein
MSRPFPSKVWSRVTSWSPREGGMSSAVHSSLIFALSVIDRRPPHAIGRGDRTECSPSSRPPTPAIWPASAGMVFDHLEGADPQISPTLGRIAADECRHRVKTDPQDSAGVDNEHLAPGSDHPWHRSSHQPNCNATVRCYRAARQPQHPRPRISSSEQNSSITDCDPEVADLHGVAFLRCTSQMSGRSTTFTGGTTGGRPRRQG